MTSSVTASDVLDTLRGLSPEARVAALREALSSVRRDNASHQYATPGDLAVDVDPGTVQTPALRLIDREVTEAVRTGGRLIVTVPPQEGKSTRVAVWTPVWALMRNPNRRIVVASYAESLARRNAMQARAIVNEYGSGATDEVTGEALRDYLGIAVSQEHRQSNSWTLAGHTGGYYATGTGGALTGRAADLLIVDDPLKNQVQADSAREREKLWDWWTSVAQTRLAPGAAVIIIMTRWHEDDLVGGILTEEQKRPEAERVWRVVNIPAVAEDGVPDALGRAPGEALVSARGRTGQDFENIRRQVGQRVWSALYQGQPTPSSGGLFLRDEIDASRVEAGNVTLSGLIVSVDPSESGHGDEAGILLMGWDASGSAYVVRDESRQATSAGWARRAVRMAVREGAADLVYEAFTAQQTYAAVLAAAWQDMSHCAELLRRHGRDALAAAEAWTAEGHVGDALTPMQETLALLDKVPDNGIPPYRVVPWRARGDKVARAAGARQSVTTGRLRMLGSHPVLERQMVTWQPGQGSPDRVDAMVNGHDHIMGQLNRPVGFAVPGGW